MEEDKKKDNKIDFNKIKHIIYAVIAIMFLIAIIVSFITGGSSSSSSTRMTDKQIEKSTGGTYQKKNGKWYYTGRGIDY